MLYWDSIRDLNTDIPPSFGLSENINAKTDIMKTYSILGCIISVGLGAVSHPFSECGLICLQNGPFLQHASLI